MSHSLTIKPLPGTFAIARFGPDAAYPAWLGGPGFQAAVRSDDELTVVCLQDRVPRAVQADRGWACLRTIGPFPFEAAGIVLSLIEPLSRNGIGVFVLCTFDGEHLLIPAKDLSRAKPLLLAAGHKWAAPEPTI